MPVFSTLRPTLKTVLLLSHAAATFVGMTPPRNPPTTREMERFVIGDLMTRTTNYQIVATSISKYILCSAAVAEALVLLARSNPGTFSNHVLILLLPSDGARRTSALQLTASSLVGCILGTTGGIIRVWCHHTLGRFFTWQMAVRDDHELVTTGPYAIVRHPSYFGWVLMICGCFILLLGRGSYYVESGLWDTALGKGAVLASMMYCAFSTVNLMMRMRKEDKVLKVKFGHRWEEYARETPYRIVPLLY